jgi:hypothetical protein
MISQAAKITWGVAVVAAIGATAYWIFSSDPVRQAEMELLRQSADEAKQLEAANKGLTSSLPSEDMDALRSANSDLLALRNQSLALTREIEALEIATKNVRVDETPEIKELAIKNQQLTGVRAQQAAVIAQANAQAELRARTLATQATPSPAQQLISRLRGPDGTLSADASKAAVDAIKSYRDANNGATPPTIDDLLQFVPAELLRENSPEQFEVISVGPGGQETRTPGDAIRNRRNR